ncbi:MAG TPA: hydantoinase, partial [Deltaproteobacteria bacterium]|nr:hydantoinase [Deltaproteobacteria bacterium]
EIEEMIVVHDVDMQFQGQTHILSFTVDDPRVSKSRLRSSFEEAYWNRFSVELPEIRPVLVNLHTAVIGRRKAVPLTSLMPLKNEWKNSNECQKGTRAVWFEQGWQETPVFHREPLCPGSRITGPALLEQMDSTVVLDPRDALEVDSFGNLIITLNS